MEETAEPEIAGGAVIRRIRKSDEPLLDEICRSDKALAHNFPGHSAWLERALAEVGEDGRVAFGAFLPEFDHEGHSRRPVLRCCCIIKRSQIDQTIELKNLAVRDRPNTGRLSEEDRRLLRLLIKKVVIFCETRDYPRVEIEVAHAMQQEVALLLSLNFKVISQREKYAAGNSFYMMQRVIGETYKGEPFDLERLALWLCRMLLPCKATLRDRQRLLGVGDDQVSAIDFTLEPAHPVFGKDSIDVEQYLLKGQMFLFENEADEQIDFASINRLRDPSRQLHFLLPRHVVHGMQPQCELENVRLISGEARLALAGGKDSSLNIPIALGDAHGVITVLEEGKIADLFVRDTFIYYLLSGRGKALLLNFEEIEDAYSLLIYCPQWSYEGSLVSGIVGFATVVSIAASDYKNAASYYRGEYPALSEEDLRRYGTYSENEPVYVLRCKTLRLLDKPIPLVELPIRKDISEYLTRELVDNWSSIAYLDQDSCRVLGKRFDEQGHTSATRQSTSEPQSGNGVFVVYSRDNAEVIDVVREMVGTLEKNGILVQWDERSLKAGMRKFEFMQAGIRAAQRVLICLTHRFVRRINEPGTGVSFEWGCIEKELRRQHDSTKFVPVLLEQNIGVPECIDHIQGLALWNPAERANRIRDLCEQLRGS